MKVNMKLKQLFSMFLALLLVCSMINYTPKTVQAVTNAVSASSSDYGLVDNVQDGVILHCWDWSFNNIKAQMATIAECGYSAIQTSPVQEAKEPTKGVSNNNWWVFYQPKSFTIDNSGNSGLGTKAEFQAMCEEAHRYGIKVIVDIVANHTGNGGANGIADTVIDDIKNDPNCYHNYGNFNEINYGSRYSITHDSMGLLPDLNTENTKIQNYVYGLLKECIDSGADGFRFDAAKHISVPSEGGEYTFWPNTVSKAKEYARSSRGLDLYCYGEILDGTGGPAMTDYTQFMSITDNEKSRDIRDGVTGGDAAKAAGSNYNKGVAASKLVLWAESHDDFQNEWRATTGISNYNINKTWAMVASRANATALYYVRTTGWRTGTIGDICTNDWKSKQVAEVNKFHNYFSGQSEYLSSNGSIAYNERGTSGVILVNCSGSSQQVNVDAHKMVNGTYMDQISGNTFTVANGKISGQIGDTGVAVVYNAEPIVVEPQPTISKEGGNFSTDTLALTIGLKNATSGTYKIGNGAAQTYTSTKTIEIGSDMAYGESITITLTATDGSKSNSAVYTFTKVEQTGNVAYLKLPSGWGTNVYCYAYDSATETISNGTWPGALMTLDSSTGYYVYEIPENIEKPRVIFYSSDSNRYPADMEKGLLFETDGSWLYADGNWGLYAPPATEGKVIIKYVDEAGNEIAASKTIKGTIGNTYTTTAETIDGYTLKTTPSNASGRYTQANITVTYIYQEIPDNEPKVTTSLASGSLFTSETQTITLTLKNAVRGTYSVDNGPVKTFTNSASVVLGQGKVADSTVTVKATATSSDGTTKNFTFTYNKKFNGTVNEENRAGRTTIYSAVSRASSNLASQYSTNKAGTGVEKTISVDGDISDWDASMKIAQGAANDDPRVYRPNSMYEVPVDLYALYAAYDDNNLYLMWEMTNVQDVVAPSDNYPISQGVLWQTQEFPFFIAVDTGKSSTAIGNNGGLTTGGTIWNSGMTIENKFNKLISINTKGGNGPFVYGGDSTGLNPVEILNSASSNIKMKYGLGILSSDVTGIDGAYGVNNNRVVGDVSNDSAAWVDFNTKGHNSSTMDFFYELSIPYDELGITKNDVQSNGVGVLLVATMGKSGLDCLPYDTSMNDNADLDDSAGSQENNSFEKSDEDHITCSFARVGSGDPMHSDDLELNFGADRSSPQTSGTALTLNGIAQGGTAPYTYKYYVNNSLVDTKTGNGAAQTAWTPSSAGSYMIKCVVTDSAGNSVTSAKQYTVEGNSSTLTGTLKVGGSTAVINNKVNDKVTLTAGASGGSGNYTYKFYVYNTDLGVTSVLRDYNASNTFTWTAESAGNREFFVDVKDRNGVVVRTNQIVVKTTAVTIPLAITGRTSASNITVGTKVTISGTATGGNGNYTYSYLLHNKDTDAWSRLTPSFVSSNTYTWTAGSAGNREFFVEVMDSTGKVVRSSAIAVNVKAAAKPLAITGTASASSVSVGTKVVIKGTAAGGNGNYTYSYLIHNKDTDTWSRLTPSFVSSNTYTWTAGSAGNREFFVEVMDSTGKVVRSSAIAVNVKAAAKPLAITGTASASSVSVGTKVVIKGTAAGGNGNYTYSYLIHNKDTDTWSRLTPSFVSSNTYTWTAGSAGNREFFVEVMDSTGKVVRSSAIAVNVKAAAKPLAITGTASASSVSVGTKVVIKGTAAGGNGNYTYSYLIHNKDTDTWSRLTPSFVSSNTYTWTAGSAGNREFFVEVKDGTGKVVRSSAISVKVTIASQPLAVTAKSSATTFGLGTSIVITGTATGGNGSYTYSFIMHNKDTGDWYRFSDFKAANKLTWTAGSTGNREFFVEVKDGTGKVVRSSAVNITVQ